jgi:hypothetical protein
MNCHEGYYSYPNTFESEGCAKMKTCDVLDYKIDCDNKNSTVQNIFCNDVEKPDLKRICKDKCEEGYIKLYDKCVECDGNK